MNSKISKNILKKIHTENIQPRSKWYFQMKNFGFWILFGLAVILGAISFSIILFALNNTDFEILEFLDQSQGWQYFMSFLPFLWIFVIGMAVGVGVWGLKHTKKGYRLALFTLLGGNVLGSLVLGSFVYGSGGGERLEEIFETKVPFYQGIRKKHQRFWGNPEENGRMGGVVLSLEEAAKILELEDPQGRIWEVRYESIAPNLLFELKVGRPIKMKGKVLEAGIFVPDRIAPAHKHRRMHQKIRKHFKEHPEQRKKFRERFRGMGHEERKALRKKMKQTLREKRPIRPETRKEKPKQYRSF